MLARPCLNEDCGYLHREPSGFCPDHAHRSGQPATGYGHAWERLSRRARQLQPWCTDCASTQQLSLDHTPEAWQRVANGKTLTLKDCEDGTLVVRCLSCNSKRGPARGHRVTRTN